MNLVTLDYADLNLFRALDDNRYLAIELRRNNHDHSDGPKPTDLLGGR